MAGERTGKHEGRAKLEEVTEAIGDYLARNPGARDSVRGIRDWWLAGLAARPSSRQVLAALALLEAQGRVARQENPEGTSVWFARAPSGSP